MFTNKKCNTNFTTQYAFINGTRVHVNDYKKTKGDLITCSNNHELVLCNGDKIKKYFRHKNTDDMCGNPMSEWHSRMQSYFPLVEKVFKKIHAEQTKDRRADVVIESHNYIVEIQHSEIDDANVICRNRDYELHGMTLIWLLDGNTTDVCVEKLSTGNYLIIFKNSWKYKSFRHTYEFILLENDGMVFKIPVKKVLNEMILVKEWKSIERAIDILNKNPALIWNEWEDDNEMKATLTVQQKGAGNGKTFGIWKSIVTNIDKELFIVVTKQHSAVKVITKELDDQVDRGEYHIEENMEDTCQHETLRKYIIKYTHKKSKRECKVIIGTIDSFVFNLTHTHKNSSDFFNAVLQTIVENGCTKVNETTGSMKYAGEYVNLDRKSELWIDETQDLSIDYFHAIVKLMLTTKIDVVAVGDKLQSLEHRKNFMTCTDEETPNIITIRNEPVNINRRIQVQGMSEQINNLVHFDAFSLPKIDFAENQVLKETNESVIQIIDAPRIYAGDKSVDNLDKITKFVDDLIQLVDKQVTDHQYVPEDFLFIFPMMKQNNTASELETKLNHYWIDKIGSNDTYKNYAVLHKHEEGQVINMDTSVNASRVVTIRTSKGDGRKVVFVLGCTEQSLKVVSRNVEVDLIYESYFHVAMTRAKEKIFFALEKNNDDIHKRFGETGIIEYAPPIKPKLKLQDILNHIDKDEVISLLQNNGIQEVIEEKKDVVVEPIVVDWQYHCIRRAIYLQYAIFIIMENNYKTESFKKSQVCKVVKDINKLETKVFSPKEFYTYLNRQGKLEDLDCLPICNMSHKTCYKGILSEIDDLIYQNKTSYKKNGCKSLGEQTPKQATIQQYAIELYMRKQFHEITPTMIYNIIHCFSKETEDETAILLKESEQIKMITKTMMNEIMEVSSDIEWNIEHMIFYGGNNSDIDIYKADYPIIGWNNDTVFHMMFKTDLSKMNYWDTMVEVLLERFLIFNPKEKGKDVNKFKKKQIKTYLIILKQNNYKVFDWNWEQSIEKDVKKLLKNAIIQHYSVVNTQLYKFFRFIKLNQDRWQNEFPTPYAYIMKQYEKVPHVCNAFKLLDKRYKTEKQSVLEITKTQENFCNYLTEIISDTCDAFFGLYENVNCDVENEW